MQIPIEDADAQVEEPQDLDGAAVEAEEAPAEPIEEPETQAEPESVAEPVTEAAAADAAEPQPAAQAAEPQAAPEQSAAEAAEAEPSVDDLLAAAAEALTKAQDEAKDWQDKYLRLHAEWDTYRRRTAEQREAEKVRAAEKLVTSLLPVIDDFERTIDYAAKNGEAELLDGVRAVHTKLVDVLQRDGVVVIDPAGEAFNALEHQAVATVPDAEAFDETVRDVYQRGYKLGTKVLRPAMVTVTSGGPKRPKEEAEEQ